MRVFDNEDFGYRRITVERPLKLNFAVTDERLAVLKESKPFLNLATSKKRKGPEHDYEVAQGEALQKSILDALESLKPVGMVKNRDEFTKLMDRALHRAGAKVAAPVKKAVLAALSEQDDTADVCVDAQGNPEPDPNLRDYENVPLKEDIGEYQPSPLGSLEVPPK